MSLKLHNIPGLKKVAHPFDVTASREFYLFIETYHTDFGRFSQKRRSLCCTKSAPIIKKTEPPKPTEPKA